MNCNFKFECKTYAKVDRRLIPFLFLCYILAYLDRVNVGFAKLEMLSDLGLSEAAFATGASIFFIGYFFFEVPSNVLLKKFGARLWIARIMVSWGVLSAATAFVTGETGFYALRFLLGIAEAGFFPGIIYYLTLWYPAPMLARRTAWFVSAVAVAGVVGNPVSGLIMDALSGSLGLDGWQWLFVLEGLPSAAVGIYVLIHLDSGIEEARWLTHEEKALLASNIAAREREKPSHSLGHALRSGKVYVLSLIYFTLVIGLYGFTFWLPTIMQRLGIEGYLEIGLVSAVPYLAAVAGMLVVSRLSDHSGRRRASYAATALAGALGLVLSGLAAGSPAASVACLSLAAFGVIAAIPLFWPMPASFLTGTAAAAGIGVINSIGNLGGYFGPNLPIWVKPVSSDPATPMYAFAALLALGAALVLAVIPASVDDQRPARDESRG